MPLRAPHDRHVVAVVAAVLRNCAGVFALFLLQGSVLVLVDRRRGRTQQPAVATTT